MTLDERAGNATRKTPTMRYQQHMRAAGTQMIFTSMASGWK